MSNTIKVKRGTTTPTTSNLQEFELGFEKNNKILYINNGGAIVPLGNSFLGGVTSAASARSTFGAAPTTHTHTYSQITNVPIDSAPTEQSTNFVTSGGVYTAVPRAVDGSVGWITATGPDGKPEWTVNSDDILEMIFPVGAIYISTVEASPAQFFSYETTWTKITDRFLVGAGNTYSSGSTGGAATVTLTTAQIPSHNHGYYKYYISYNSSSYDAHISGGSLYYWQIGNSWTTSGSTGGGGRTKTYLHTSPFGYTSETRKRTYKPAFRRLYKGVG